MGRTQALELAQRKQIAAAGKAVLDKIHSLDDLPGALKELRNDPEFAPEIVSEPEVPGIERVGAGEVDYLLLVKTQPGAQYRVSRALRRKVKECFERNQIEVPGPTKIYVAASDRPGAEEVK